MAFFFIFSYFSGQANVGASSSPMSGPGLGPAVSVHRPAGREPEQNGEVGGRE